MSANKIPLVAIGLPCGDMVHAQFTNCLWGVGRGARDHRQGVVMAHSSIVAHGRSNCVAGMYQIQADYLMFIDSDMMFPPNTIDRLLKHEKDIVGCTYVRRGPPFDNLGHTAHDVDRGRKSGLVEMAYIPTGMLLIKKEVFDKMKPPFFRYETDEEHGIVRGEDMVFSDMVRSLGFKMWCDLDLSKELRHIYTYMLSPEDPTTRKVAENFKLVANG